MNIEISVKKIISKITSTPEKDINENTSMENLSKWDSLAQVKIIIDIEKKYKKIKTSDLIDLTSVKDIVSYLNKK
ncbi:acyl carrier protein [Candidatus Pelagibacter ubique]|jgi:acyl carrier protein|nr:acyl carrier protein [Candidatus Pelagibacter ubique]